jgi:phage terminase large subunit-like protein
MAAPSGGWDFSCTDWPVRLAAGQSLIPDLPLDAAIAARAVRIFDNLQLPDVGGKPEMRVAAGDWIREIVAALFGSVDDTGRRWVNQPFLLVPKKNSKTTNGAAIMVTALLMEEEPNQKFFLFGPTKEIAQLAFDQACGMIEADPDLTARFHIATHMKLITDRVTGSKLKVQTFGEKVATGGIPKGMLIDEVHLLGKDHKAQRVLGQLTGQMITRRDAFLVMITTQSDEPPAGVFKENLDLARAIRDGRVTGDAATLLPILYEFTEELQTAKPGKDGKRPWENPALWHMVLPNLGRSITLDILVAKFAEAKAKGEGELRRWASQHLNIEIGLGMHSARWRGADHWEGAEDPELVSCSLAQFLDRCSVVVAGVDGGGLDDLYGLALVGRCKVTGEWLVWARAWAHQSVLDLRKDIAPRLLDFVADGDLILTEGDADIEEIAALLKQVRDSGLMPEKAAVGLDPQGIGVLVTRLRDEDIGFTDDQLVPVGQGFRLSSAAWSSERKLADGTMWHAGQAMLTWCVGNAKAEQAGNGVYISKAVAGKAKIDPLIAMLNAVKLMERGPVAQTVHVSPYASRGFLRV